MTIGELIDYALKIRDEIRKETGKHLELAVSTFSFGTICESIEIRAYYKPEGEEKWWVTKQIYDRHVLEVDGKGLIDHFFINIKQQMSFTAKHRPPRSKPARTANTTTQRKCSNARCGKKSSATAPPPASNSNLNEQ